MIGVEMAFATIVSVAKFFEHSVKGRIAESKAPEVRDYIRLPTAIHAAPAVSSETENAQSAVMRIVSAVTA